MTHTPTVTSVRACMQGRHDMSINFLSPHSKVIPCGLQLSTYFLPHCPLNGPILQLKEETEPGRIEE